MWGVLSISLFFLPFNRLIAWLFLAASAGMGMYHGVLTRSAWAACWSLLHWLACDTITAPNLIWQYRWKC
ncbi:Uncharacterised protein [Serratia plymuthica]|nr:Uncharacterised protein [Serratia plymuthica]